MGVIGVIWKKLLKECMEKGEFIRKDDSKILELMGNYIFLERPQDIDFPLHQTVYTSEKFLENMEKGLYNIQNYPLKDDALVGYVTSWYDVQQKYNADPDLLEEYGFDPKKGFVYTYPERVLHIPLISENKQYCYINQMHIMKQRLLSNLGTNRSVATLYQAGLDGARVDIPCLQWLQATVRNDKLELHCIFRSNDLFGAWPSNMYFLTLFGLDLTNSLNKDIQFNGIHYHSSSLHIYETDLPMVRRVLNE